MSVSSRRTIGYASFCLEYVGIQAWIWLWNFNISATAVHLIAGEDQHPAHIWKFSATTGLVPGLDRPPFGYPKSSENLFISRVEFVQHSHLVLQ